MYIFIFILVLVLLVLELKLISVSFKPLQTFVVRCTNKDMFCEKIITVTLHNKVPLVKVS